MTAAVGLRLRAIMLQATFAPPPGFNMPLPEGWLALTRSVPLANSTGAELDEPTEGSYSRSLVQMGPEHWRQQGGEIFNIDTIITPTPTADWGLIMGWALVDSEQFGYTLAVGSLVEPTQILTGQQKQLPPGTIVIGLYD